MGVTLHAASPSGSATGSTPSASATSTPEVSARASENSTGGNDAVERSGGGPDAGLSTDSQGVSKRSSGGLMPVREDGVEAEMSYDFSEDAADAASLKGVSCCIVLRVVYKIERRGWGFRYIVVNGGLV